MDPDICAAQWKTEGGGRSLHFNAPILESGLAWRTYKSCTILFFNDLTESI
jgi:hypothetical protein